ncbi:SDR family NAD(P)-dependent oxidoreductase [Phyllobacterium myrsinacearum]|uniref:NAD(P)-dependent dehydrogenase (Short-subunit alcohol dehydrogenase family) n=1 Tax=Phyllobacterium myrsinacearum TaxID=28101 RepID=A0A839ERU4_9HYPH|nr:SDR family NAD(P)-dependent oxidoreductase [Phyllobacterium myrsinacearum]MBA8880835.1 NAD(P)-dependent dehydrogenase (short-subunit alcohol dehydrogenase family) [Phyllobacterium myrsinacearum]
MQRTWFITGATRGLGVEIAKAAIRAGDRVVATGRRKSAVTEALGPDSEQLLAVELDVTNADQAQAAVQAAISRFGTIDVLVNNAGYGQLGFFEENTVETVNTQFATNVHGVFNVTWAVLPVMRAARKGHIFNISSIAGLRGGEFGSLYSASKFALEGFSESLALEIASFGLFVTIVEPGPFRTDFLTGDSLRIGDANAIADYDDRRTSQRAAFESRNGSQPGDPAKLADAMVVLSSEAKPPLRFVAGAMAFNAAATKFSSMQAELELWRQLSLNTDGPDGSW